MKKRIGYLLSLIVLLSACANTPTLTPSEVRQQFDSVATLETQLKESASKELDVLSPNRFKQAKKSYKEAYELAVNNDRSANEVACTQKQPLAI